MVRYINVAGFSHVSLQHELSNSGTWKHSDKNIDMSKEKKYKLTDVGLMIKNVDRGVLGKHWIITRRLTWSGLCAELRKCSIV